jgi:hypothetical protein
MVAAVIAYMLALVIYKSLYSSYLLDSKAA